MSRIEILPRTIILSLICALAAPAVVHAAPKQNNPVTVQDRVVKLGVDRWVCVDTKEGLVLVGRITGIGDQSFGLQLHNYPEITVMQYADVIRVRGVGLTGKGAAALIALPIAAGVTGALILHHEFEVNKPQLPTLPPAPVLAQPAEAR